MGRHMVFDSTDHALRSKSGVVNAIVWVTSGHFAYCFKHWIPDPTYYKASIALFSFMTFKNVIRLYSNNSQISRLYLMKDMQ